MGYDFSVRQEHIPTFLHPEGLPDDPEPFVTEWGLVLPGIITSTIELDDLKGYAQDAATEGIHERPLPTPRQLGRISLNSLSGCWELPVYGNGSDTHTTANGYTKPGQLRARYGSLTVAGASDKPTDKLAHRTMYAVMRGGIPDDHLIDHLCRNHGCCWHRHLEAVTAQENTRRRYDAGRLIGITE